MNKFIKELDLSEAPHDYIEKAVRIVQDLTEKTRMANFPLSVSTSERQPSYHSIVDSLDALGISQPKFIAIHALSVCLNDMDQWPSRERAAELKPYLEELVVKIYGSEFKNDLDDFVQGHHSEVPLQDTDSTWKKLGALKHVFYNIDMYGSADPESIERVYGRKEFKKLCNAWDAVARSCVNDAPSLSKLYEPRKQTLQTLLDRIGPAPSYDSLPPS